MSPTASCLLFSTFTHISVVIVAWLFYYCSNNFICYYCLAAFSSRIATARWRFLCTLTNVNKRTYRRIYIHAVEFIPVCTYFYFVAQCMCKCGMLFRRRDDKDTSNLLKSTGNGIKVCVHVSSHVHLCVSKS